MDWEEGETLTKTFTFKDFVEALAFVNKVGALAEEAGHHPDITITYNEVTLSLITHDADAITDKDYRLAEAIDAISQ